VLRSAHAAAKSSMWMVPPCRSASCHPRSILCCCCGEPGSGILASCPSGRQHTHIHTHSRTENRPPHAPRPAHVHIPDDGSAVAHAANDGPTRRPQLRARSFVSPNGVNRMSSQISSASIESMENADTTGSEISPALISTTAVRKYGFEIYLLWKSMQRTLRSKVSDKKACLRRSFPHLLSTEGACVLAFTDIACAIRCEWADGEAHQCHHLRRPTIRSLYTSTLSS
jgi:hypothetical protein